MPQQTIKRKANAVRSLSKCLPQEVIETSGLVYFDNTLWTHNDGGNDPKLYQIDSTTGKILKTATLLNTENTDWEDITHDDKYVYIGDFGNNFCQRRSFQIHRVAKADLQKTDTAFTVPADSICFSYDDLLQQDNYAPDKHNFDCEAFIVKDGYFFLFTKNRNDSNTNLYTLPATEGTHVAKRIATFPANGMITGATYNPDENILCLCGYKVQRIRVKPFLLVFHGFAGNNFFGGKYMRLNFKYQLKQIEGIEYKGDKTYFYSNEGFKKIITLSKPRLYELHIDIGE